MIRYAFDEKTGDLLIEMGQGWQSDKGFDFHPLINCLQNDLYALTSPIRASQRARMVRSILPALASSASICCIYSLFFLTSQRSYRPWHLSYHANLTTTCGSRVLFGYRSEANVISALEC